MRNVAPGIFHRMDQRFVFFQPKVKHTQLVYLGEVALLAMLYGLRVVWLPALEGCR
jgi:hypothetical protein